MQFISLSSNHKLRLYSSPAAFFISLLLVFNGLSPSTPVQKNSDEAIIYINNAATEKIESYTEDKRDVFNAFFENYEHEMTTFVNRIETEIKDHPNQENRHYQTITDATYERLQTNYIYIGLTTKEMLLSPDTLLPPGYDPTARPWYQDAIENDVHWSSVYIDATNGNPIATISATFKDPHTNEIAGVAGMDISLQSLFNTVNTWHANDTGYYMVLDDQGIIQSHPDSSQIGFKVLMSNVVEYLKDAPSDVAHLQNTFQGKEGFTSIFKTKYANLYIVYVDLFE